MSQQPSLILASKSPRRRYLLKKAGLDFMVIPSDLDESAVPETEPAAYVRTLAEAKARDIASRHPDSWVIGADTIVSINERILGKPASIEDARVMLRNLSGRTHQVFTGYCILQPAIGFHYADTAVTDVTFKRLTDREIDWYVSTGEPFDKAGAYAIQGMGTFLVRSINGSYTNVVGLPVCEVVEILIREGVMDLEDMADHSHIDKEDDQS